MSEFNKIFFHSVIYILYKKHNLFWGMNEIDLIHT